MFHLRLIGTSSSRSSSRTACSEIASPTPRSAPELLDPRHHARGRDGDPPPRQVEAVLVHGQPQRRHGGVVIEQRLAHAHHDDVGEQPALAAGRPLLERVARDQHLRHDLGRRQIAHQRHGAGVAEAAGQRAADLGRDAQGAPVVLRDEDGLDLLAVGEAQQPLAGAVARALLGRDLGPCHREAGRELLRSALGSVVMASNEAAPR